MTERWRRPVKLVGIESSIDTMRIGDRTYRDYEYLLKREDWERIRQGYVCIQCFEPHEVPFPARCPVCGTTASQQRDRIPLEFAGETRVGSSVSLDDERADLADRNDRTKHQPQSSILLPRGVNL